MSDACCAVLLAWGCCKVHTFVVGDEYGSSDADFTSSLRGWFMLERRQVNVRCAMCVCDVCLTIPMLVGVQITWLHALDALVSLVSN